ncbi:hypothetical protein [Streptomyces sp. NPDC026659]|uniref:hypothetical protein n=1 Tax=Streptomyces sp. NPDC026659 TaxID=3155123 RepID=UPI0033F5580C
MSTRRAAARLAELWPRLPVLAGADWLMHRPGLVAEIEAMETAPNDGERAARAGRLLALAGELPAVLALLGLENAVEADGVGELPWGDVALALAAAAKTGGRFQQASRLAARALGEYTDGPRLTNTLLAAGIAAALGLGTEELAEPEQWEESGPLGERRSTLGGSVPRLVPWADPLPWLVGHPEEAQWIADTWQLAVGARHRVRLLTDVENAEAAAVLLQGAGVASVLNGAWTADASEVPRWSWPLRLAVPAVGGPAVPLQQELLTAAGAKAGLLSQVATEGRWSRASLLLVPHAGDGDALRSPGGPHATAVIVVCESPELVPTAKELQSLAVRHRAAFAATAHPGPTAGRWLETLLDRLSLDLPLDMALHGTAEELGLLPPVMAADPRFLDSTRIRPVLAAVPPDALEPSEQARVGRALRGGPGAEDTRLAPAAASDLRAMTHRARRTPARYLRADVVGPDGTTPALGIAPHGVFHVRVLLAAAPGAHPAEPVFPADTLPPGRAHRLTVLATDLTLAPGHDRAATQEIELPGDGDSTCAHLRFTAGDPGTDIRIWVAVLYGSRILQTGLLTGQAGAREAPVFRVESVVRAPTGELDLARPHDATLLVGRTAHDLPLVTARTKEFVHRTTSHDLRRSLDVLLHGLSRLVNGADSFGSYQSPEFAELVIDTARRGRRLRKALFPDDWESGGLVRQLREARSVSVFSAAPEAILPVELLYERELETAPGRQLHLCPHAPAQVDRHDCGDCPEREDRTSVCPFGFWGTSKVIERHVRRESADTRFALAVSADIDRHACDLDPACAAAAARADHNDVHAWTTAAGALAEAEPGAVRLAGDWTELYTLVRGLREADTPPGAVLLFPHSVEKGDGVTALGLGEDDEVDILDGLEFLFARDGGPEPVVLLLGCATAGGTTPFSDASTALLDDGAPGVVATAVPVLGQHIVPVGVRLLAELRTAAAETSGSPLGEALLRARRKLLVNGDACVLALVGFGDTDWEVRAGQGTPSGRQETP